MLLFTVTPVDHPQASHAQGSTVFVNGDGARDGVRSAAVVIEVDERPDPPFPAEAIGGIVVMCGIQAEIPDGDVRVDGLKFAKADDSADAVMPSCIEEADMEWEVDADVSIMGTKHIKGVPEIRGSQVAVPAPVGIGVREMPSAGAMWDTVFPAFADFMPVRGGMGMDTGAVAGKGEAMCRDYPVPEGRDNGGKPEKLLEPFFIMEWERLMGEGISGQRIRDPGMLIRKFLSFAGYFGKLFVLVRREEILPAGFLVRFWLEPEPVHEVKVSPQGRQGRGSTASQGSKEAVGLEFFDPGGKAGKAKHQHEDEGADDLGLVFSGPADRGIEAGKVFHYRIQVQQTKLLPDRSEFEPEPCALGRIKMYFCLMQEIKVLLMGLPVNQHMCVLLWFGEK